VDLLKDSRFWVTMGLFVGPLGYVVFVDHS